MTMTGKSPTEDRPSWLGGLAGTLMLGVICSSFGALVGAVAWATIAVWTNYEIGYVAWALGLMAGVGMRVGFRDGSSQAAVAAAVIALLGIIAGKSMAVGYVYQKEIALSVKMMTNNDERLNRLAMHGVDRETEELGICPEDSQWDEVWTRQNKRVFALQEYEIESEIAALDQWEAGGRWSDERYVRNRLVHELALTAFEEAQGLDRDVDDEFYEIEPEIWEIYHAPARQQADSMSVEERVAELKRIEAERDRHDKIVRLAYHRSARKGDSLGLPPYSDQRDELYEEERSKAKKLSDAKLDAAIAKLDAWEDGGRWEDKKFVRDYVIYSELNPPYSQEGMSTDELNDAEVFGRRYAEVAAKFDAMSAAERVVRAKEAHAESQQRIEAMLARMSEYRESTVRSQLVGFAGGTFSAIVKSMLNPIDLLFVVLALGTAYKVSSGFADDTE